MKDQREKIVDWLRSQPILEPGFSAIQIEGLAIAKDQALTLHWDGFSAIVQFIEEGPGYLKRKTWTIHTPEIAS